MWRKVEIWPKPLRREDSSQETASSAPHTATSVVIFVTSILALERHFLFILILFILILFSAEPLYRGAWLPLIRDSAKRPWIGKNSKWNKRCWSLRCRRVSPRVSPVDAVGYTVLDEALAGDDKTRDLSKVCVFQIYRRWEEITLEDRMEGMCVEVRDLLGVISKRLVIVG